MRELSEIEDSQVSRGLRGKRLEKALASDKRYQKLLREKRKSMPQKILETVSQELLKKYPLPTKQDFEILALANKLSLKKISKQDAEIVELILSQLEYAWRKGLLARLRKLDQKYGKKFRK